MPSSEEESQWLVGSGGGLAPSGGNATKTVAGERGATTRSGLYTEEMTTQPASVAAAGANSASADSAEHDLIDSTADATLLAQFHEDAIKQVTHPGCSFRRRFRVSEFEQPPRERLSVSSFFQIAVLFDMRGKRIYF